MGKGVSVISSGEETAREVSTILSYKGILNESDVEPKHEFYTTGSSTIFAKIASEWLEQPIEVVETIKLGKRFESY